MIYIYALVCPVKKIIRYIGSTKNPKTRFKQHIKDALNNRTDKQKWILSLKKTGDLPIISIIAETNNETLARQFEEENVIKNIATVFNIHLPGKNHGYVEQYRKTGKKDKRHI